jgi:alkyl hydroperoxide reductase subunit AhpC
VAILRLRGEHIEQAAKFIWWRPQMPWAVGLWRQRTLGQGGTFGKIIFPSMPPLRVFFLATLHRKTEMMLSRRTLVAAEQTGLYSGHIQMPELSQARGGKAMALAINDTAPDFEAETTEGKIRFHDWIGDKWVVLFSHPKDFTPVCTTELGYMAKIKPEFDKRGVKIIGLSVDPVDKHAGWAADIKETQGYAPNYPMIGDTDYNVSKLYGMLPAAISGDPAKRTAADNQTVRNVFIIGPDKKIKLILVYPMTVGRNFDEVLRVIDSLQLGAKHKISTPVNWKPGEDVIIAGSVTDEDAKKQYPAGWKSPKPYIRIVPQPKA